MGRLICLLIFLSLCAFHLTAFSHSQDKKLFQELFEQWTTAFNHKNLAKSCDLFSKRVTADYRGTGKKNYFTICHGFEKIFAEKNKRYLYHFTLHDVFRSGNLATVRITWYLKVYENNKQITQVQDEGIDVLLRSKQGKWQIINYLAYPV